MGCRGSKERRRQGWKTEVQRRTEFEKIPFSVDLRKSIIVSTIRKRPAMSKTE